MQRGRWNLAALSCHTKSLVWKNSTAAAARPQTNCITYTHSRKRIQKPSTLLHSTSQHTKKAENPQKKKQNPIKIHKQNPHRILKNKTPKTNQPAVCSAIDFDLVGRHVLLPASLLFLLLLMLMLLPLLYKNPGDNQTSQTFDYGLPTNSISSSCWEIGIHQQQLPLIYKKLFCLLLLLLLLSIENSLPYQSCVSSSGWCCCYLRLQTQSSKPLHTLKY